MQRQRQVHQIGVTQCDATRRDVLRRHAMRCEVTRVRTSACVRAGRPRQSFRRIPSAFRARTPRDHEGDELGVRSG